jgi:hypothetical protein
MRNDPMTEDRELDLWREQWSGVLFLGPRRLRVGWRLLIFIGLLVVLFGGFGLVRSGGPQGLQEKENDTCKSTQGRGICARINWTCQRFATRIRHAHKIAKAMASETPIKNGVIVTLPRCFWAKHTGLERRSDPRSVLSTVPIRVVSGRPKTLQEMIGARRLTGQLETTKRVGQLLKSLFKILGTGRELEK